jgi:Zn-dependent protease
MMPESTTVLAPPPLPPPLPVAVSPREAAWAELHLQQMSKGSWLNGLLLLAITLSAALGVGSHQWTFENAIVIVGILFIHEMGHYLAMRWFGYREVRMFFIPLFGAAVTGRNYNVPGWKKAVVSLMGPVPSIFLGTFVGVIAAVVGNQWLAEVSMLAVLINAINLLPILPLDGGWFWNAVVFCRHHTLELIFKVFAALAAFGATIAGLGKIWMYLGIVTLVGVPVVNLQGKIIQSLRRKGFTPPSGDDDTLPRELGDSIFDELNQTIKGVSPKAAANLALRIFGRLNARPPGVLESIGLVVLYLIAIIAALIGFSIAGYTLFGDPAAVSPTVE